MVPTRYIRANGQTVATNQYSVTMHRKTLGGSDHGLPGAFFMYDMSPILVQLSERRRSFLHFLTGVCAIVGGVFTGAAFVVLDYF